MSSETRKSVHLNFDPDDPGLIVEEKYFLPVELQTGTGTGTTPHPDTDYPGPEPEPVKDSVDSVAAAPFGLSAKAGAGRQEIRPLGIDLS